MQYHIKNVVNYDDREAYKKAKSRYLILEEAREKIVDDFGRYYDLMTEIHSLFTGEFLLPEAVTQTLDFIYQKMMEGVPDYPIYNGI